MKYLRPLLCLIAFPTFLFAQSNYKPGYIVTLKGDTVKGFIDYREWNLNPGQIDFKNSADETVSKKYTPKDIAFFNISNFESYARYSGPVTMDATDPNLVGDDRDTSVDEKTVFLKVMQKGSRLTLYTYQDELKKRYFVSESSGTVPVELIFRLSRKVAENTFQRQLNNLALRYNALNDNLTVYISRAEYTDNNLLYVVSKINNIDQKTLKANAGGPAYQWFAAAGLSITNRIPLGDHELNASGAIVTSVLPMVSGGIDLFANPATRKLLFRLELMLDGGQYTYYYSYNVYRISVLPQMIYNIYDKDDFKFFAGIGLGADKYFYSNPAFADPDFTTSFLLTAGVRVSKNLAFTGRYLFNSSSAKDTQIGIGYFFK